MAVGNLTKVLAKRNPCTQYNPLSGRNNNCGAADSHELLHAKKD